MPLLGRVLAGIGGLPATPEALTFNLALQMPSGFGQVSPSLMALGLLVILALIPLVLLILRVNRRVRISDTWGCGRIGQTPRMEYTATAFAEPLRRVFSQLLRPTRELSIDFHPESKYFVQSIAYRSEITAWFERLLYQPVLSGLRLVARQVRRLQSGSLHLYLLYISLTLVVLLLVARWIQ
jgi:hypothetical protein